MRHLICLGDKTSHGGEVISASSTIKIKGITVALVGDLVSCPISGHGITAILPDSCSIQMAGQQVALQGFQAGCGCTLIAGQSTTSAIN
ncbi:PAAR domain-containing protein [Pragia fontium]|uniref:PAAR domain-containing protein n=1 Tax=Pragia fontium TaxID=82985 RepID=UPI000DFE43FB|nr:PAAR domain-containing protein [Pragia fontium]SUB81670.1 Uncharacterized conserved protein [Pragia fontium]VEJ54185.1 Uncharacterized conserved protein [Pragia fontium]